MSDSTAGKHEQGEPDLANVKRYLQGSHQDRLLHPMERDPSSPDGFRRITWDEALDRVVSEIRRIQSTYGDDAFAMLSGVSLTNEKSYLIGKFARLALHTANLDYNGRFCMVSAGGANKKAFGVDRASNPWSDIPLADVVWIAGSNVAETFPITTSYIWRARDRGQPEAAIPWSQDRAPRHARFHSDRSAFRPCPPRKRRPARAAGRARTPPCGLRPDAPRGARACWREPAPGRR